MKMARVSFWLLLVAGWSGGISADANGTAPPTTVISHGFQLSGTVPDWPYALADAIARRAGAEGGADGRVYVYEPATGDLSACQEVWCTTSGVGHTVIVFDWADDSNEEGAGFSEAAAAALFAGLLTWSQEPSPVVDLDRLHFIGHSRGTVVNSEVAERLIAAGLPPPVQVTTLDPHDAGGAFLAQNLDAGGLDDYDVNWEHPEYDCHAQSSTPGVCSWIGTGYNDNYWQNDSACLFIYPRGMELYGVANFHQNALDDPFCHSDTHRWYLLTADTDALTHPVTGNPPGVDWYGSGTDCSTIQRTTPLARTADGYNLSETGAGTANRCPAGPNSLQQVLFDFGLQEGLVNGDFERIRAGQEQAGWSFHGGAMQASLGADTDNYLILQGGEWARHNRFHLPAATKAIQLCRKVAAASPSDLLSMLISSAGAADREMLTPAQQTVSAAADWDCLEAAVLPSETGKTAQIQLSLTNSANPTVFIDDIRLFVPIFEDGFENGETSAWSATMP